MPRTIESILDSFDAATDRRKAGRPIWDHRIDLSGIFHREDLTFEEQRDQIVAVLSKHPWVTQDNWHGWDLLDLVTDLGQAGTPDEFDEVWDAIYDEADYDRVWIKTT